jgi:hypothetical protein
MHHNHLLRDVQLKLESESFPVAYPVLDDLFLQEWTRSKRFRQALLAR